MAFNFTAFLGGAATGVSDFADENAETDWNNNVHKGAELFKEILEAEKA